MENTESRIKETRLKMMVGIIGKTLRSIGDYLLNLDQYTELGLQYVPERTRRNVYTSFKNL